MRLLFIIGAGGFIGSVLRYLTSRLFQQLMVSSFPYGTLAVNIIGCFVLGVVYALAEKNAIVSDEMRLFLTVGICGGFTTFSTFANENMSFLRDGEFFQFALYASVSLLLGLIALYFGNLTVKLF
ncbi:MAG: fluoride efflux transporter CrcB [Bacteroidales bacterium]|jgi:CrcB protein